MKKIALLLCLLCCSSTLLLHAQKKGVEKSGYELIFNIKNASDQKISLVIHYKGKYILKDSAFVSSPGRYVFKGEEPLDNGLYTLVSSHTTPYLSFIMDKNQHFEISLDTTGKIGRAHV